MTKIQFLLALRDRLTNVPAAELEERLRFYTEMIEDRVEEGLSEEDAVAAAGSVEEIAAQILADLPLQSKEPKKPAPKNRRKVWEIILLLLGAPLWLPLLIAAFAAALSLYVSIWAIIFSLWSVFASTAALAIGGVMAGIGCFLTGHIFTGIVMCAAAAVCCGMTILLFFGCKWITVGTACLSKRVLFGKKRTVKAREVTV